MSITIFYKFMETDTDSIIKLSVLGILMALGVWYLFRGALLYMLWIILIALDLIYLFIVIFANNTTSVDLIPPLIILAALIFWITKMEKKS